MVRAMLKAIAASIIAHVNKVSKHFPMPGAFHIGGAQGDCHSENYSHLASAWDKDYQCYGESSK